MHLRRDGQRVLTNPTVIGQRDEDGASKTGIVDLTGRLTGRVGRRDRMHRLTGMPPAARTSGRGGGIKWNVRFAAGGTGWQGGRHVENDLRVRGVGLTLLG